MSNKAPLDEIKRLIAQRIGLRIADGELKHFAEVLRVRAANLGYSTVMDYQVFLADHQDSSEWEELVRVLTSPETFFFRDHGQFDLLRLHLLPELISQHREDKTLRLWSAACSSGEEVYSLAMLLDMLLPVREDWNILLLGTDIDSNAITKAAQGRYGQWSFRMMPPEFQQRYFHLEKQKWVLSERILRMVSLRVANLLDERSSELHDMDLILCRNVFIYFDPAAVSAVASRLAAAMRLGGYLMTAHTELIGYPVPELKSRLFAEGVVYQRVACTPAESPTCLRVSTEQRQAPPVREMVLRASVEKTSAALDPPLAVSSDGGALFKKAQAYADRGEFDLAEQLCHQALSVNSLATAPYFLLAQLSQIKGDFQQAMALLNKVLYLDHYFVAAQLELAALYKRTDDMPRARALRSAALAIVRAMPADERVDKCEATAGELVKWLTQCEREAISFDEKRLSD